MKFDNHFMIDIETLGNNPDAILLSFCITHFVGDTINDSLTCNISLESCIKNGLKMTASTLKFWMKQDKELFNKQLDGNLELAVAIQQLRVFVHNNYHLLKQNRFWAYGTLDFEVLENCCRVLGVVAPWYYNEKMDLRTLSNFFPEVPFVRNGELHNPEVDCKNQIEHLLKLLK